MKQNKLSPYSVLDELMASDSQPLPAEKRTYQLMRMRQGLDDLMHAAMPSADSWRVLMMFHRAVFSLGGRIFAISQSSSFRNYVMFQGI